MSDLPIQKPLQQLMREASEEGSHTLKRVLGPWALTALGIGVIIGAGIFVLAGQAAHDHAGPAAPLSLVAAGIARAFAGLCYAEFASPISIAGSAAPVRRWSGPTARSAIPGPPSCTSWSPDSSRSCCCSTSPGTRFPGLVIVMLGLPAYFFRRRRSA